MGVNNKLFIRCSYTKYLNSIAVINGRKYLLISGSKRSPQITRIVIMQLQRHNNAKFANFIPTFGAGRNSPTQNEEVVCFGLWGGGEEVSEEEESWGGGGGLVEKSFNRPDWDSADSSPPSPRPHRVTSLHETFQSRALFLFWAGQHTVSAC